MMLLFILSRKSKLCSVPKPKNWEALPAKYENNMPLHHRISYITSIITILCAMVTFIVTLSLKAFGHGTSGYEMCFDTVHSTVSSNQSLQLNSTNITELNVNRPMVYCIRSVLYIINIPSIFAMLIVTVYLLMWINYCCQLFQGINFELKNMADGDLLLLRKCRGRYWALCTLVDHINSNYGSLIATYIFTTLFLIFINGYIVAKAAIIGHTISVDRIIVYLAMITIVARLFYASGTLKIEV